LTVYTNAFLATLNARQSTTPGSVETSHMLMSMPPSMLSTTVNGGSSQKVSQGISIRIERTTTRAYPDLVCRHRCGGFNWRR